MMTGGGDNKRFMSDINVTPFVDVMLVLLIIFMVTAPMMIQGVDVNLPQTTAKELKTAQEEPLILTVNKDSQISIEKTVIKLEELGPKLNAILQYREDKQVLLRADEQVPYGFVAKVISSAKSAGIERLGLITQPED